MISAILYLRVFSTRTNLPPTCIYTYMVVVLRKSKRLYVTIETRTVRGSDYSPTIELSEQKGKLVTATGDTEKYSEKQAKSG